MCKITEINYVGQPIFKQIMNMVHSAENARRVPSCTICEMILNGIKHENNN